MKRIGILTSGGDAPGMNACIRAAVRTALASHIEILGVRQGFAGLIHGNLAPLDRQQIANIVHRGGTILETSRSPEFETKEGRAAAIRVLKESGVEGLILLGGDGTFRGGNLLAQECEVGIVGVPATIDNDVYGTDYSIGFDTAVNCALQAIDRIRDTANSLERLFFIEVMGHHTGFIALEAGIAGGAEEILIPEQPMGLDRLCRQLKSSFEYGKRSAIVIVAEGKSPGRSFDIAQVVKKRINMDSRVCVLGHIQRGGSPTARDRVLAGKLGNASVRALIDGKGGHMVGEVNNRVTHTPLQDTYQKQKELDPELQALTSLLCQ